jgi:hypothetical protein
MKSYFFAIYCALKLTFIAAPLVLASDLARAEMASIYGGRDGLCGRPNSERGASELRGNDSGASHAGLWHARSRLPQRMRDGAD